MQKTHLIKDFIQYMQRTLETQEQEEKIIQLKIKLKVLAETSSREDTQMGNKNIRKCFTLYTIREREIKTRSYHDHLTEHPKPRTLTTPSTGRGIEEQKLSFTLGMHNGTATLEDSLASLKK